MNSYLDQILDNIINESREELQKEENKKLLIENKTVLTGDTHGKGLSRFKSLKNSGCSEIIVCGDFGYVWNNINENNYYLNILNNYGYKILFVDGNHEDFDELEKYPFEDMFGGTVQVLRENVIHLLRGEVYQINNKKIFVMGGAASTDREHRVTGMSWWPQEIPNKKERDKAIKNLKANNNKVDIILTHTAPSSVLKLMGADYRSDEFTDFLEYINKNVQFEHWYFGHMHVNKKIDDKHTCLYDTIMYL